MDGEQKYFDLIVPNTTPVVMYAEPREMTPTQIRFVGRCDNAVADYVSSLLKRVIMVYGAHAVPPARVAPEGAWSLPIAQVGREQSREAWPKEGRDGF
jgi:hypothetical protein